MNNDSINFTINGITKIAIPFVALFLVKATKDIICKWLDNKQPVQCTCICSNNEQTSQTEQNIEIQQSEQFEQLSQTEEQPKKQNIKNKIVDNYHKKVVSGED